MALVHKGQAIPVGTDGLRPEHGLVGPDDLQVMIQSVTDPSENLTLSNGTAFPAYIRVSVMKPHLPMLDMEIHVRNGVPRLSYLGMKEWTNPDAEESPGNLCLRNPVLPNRCGVQGGRGSHWSPSSSGEGSRRGDQSHTSKARERRVMDRDHLLRVAEAVNGAPLGIRPRVAIQRVIPCSDRTAYRWLNAARKRD